jgi:hypothetical protein
MRWQVAAIVERTFEPLGVSYPKPRGELLRELEAARKKLKAE